MKQQVDHDPESPQSEPLPPAGEKENMLLADEVVCLNQMSLFLKWLFGPPGLHIRDYAGRTDKPGPSQPKQEGA